ncbi:hypothetical protein Pfo_014807 [Paulownia fortunei]|nr:hypothetical protein Pfo_014807 [Paulownia fortunei]
MLNNLLSKHTRYTHHVSLLRIELNRVRAIGINYGLNGDNLPAPRDVISLLKTRNIPKIRLFEPNQDVLKALQGSGISMIIGTRNEDLQALASNLSIATKWVETNVVPYSSVNIICIAAGSEVFPGELAKYIPGAMQNLDSALISAKIAIPVSTAVSMGVLSVSHPPSQGLFSPAAAPVMTQVTTFLQSKHSPLLLNAYPYFPRIMFQANVGLDYALFEDTATPDPDDPFTYRNLLDAMVDAVHAALEKAGGPDVEVIVSETGWPTEGSSDASIENAKIFNNNLIKHVSSGKGTPRRPGKLIEAYIFSLFNEDLKPDGVEQHWGLYYPNMTEVYHIDL